MPAPKADEMFVGKKEDAPVTGDARDDSNRLKSSGMERDRTDKNPVQDEHDFTDLRGQLGNRGSAPKADDERLEAAKAKVGIEPGAAKVSNQMFVAKKDAEAVSTDARDDANRLKSSGMHRDRTDKNPVQDEFNFADLRKSLGKKGGGSEPPPVSPSVAPSQGVGSPTVVPPTPQKGPSSKAGSVASMPRSAAGEPAPAAPASPAASAQRLSRQGSVANPASPASVQPSMVGTPKAASVASPAHPMSQPQGTPQPQSPSQPGGLSRHSSTRSVQQSVAPSAVQELPPRTSSRAGSVAGSVPGSVAVSQPPPPPQQAGSAAGSQPALSRQGSAVAASLPASRQASMVSHHSRISQPYSPTSTQQPPPQPVQEDELAGVDWKLTADKVSKKLAETEKKLDKKDGELKAEKAETRELRSKIQTLESRLEQALAAPRGADSATGESGVAPMLRLQLESKQEEVEKLEDKVRSLEVKVSEMKRQSSNRGSTSSMQHVVQLQEMQKEIVKYKAAYESRETIIKQLTQQLEAAHEAIIASAHKGFEIDIKLHQARATLVAMLKEEKSPRRGSASPRQSASHHQTPRAGSGPASPTAQMIHHYSPVIKTPGSPRSLR